MMRRRLLLRYNWERQEWLEVGKYYDEGRESLRLTYEHKVHK